MKLLCALILAILSATVAQAQTPGYAGRVQSAIRSNIVYAEPIVGNPTTEVEVRLAPDGAVLSMKLLKASGLPSWDAAVMRAIQRTERLPLDADGKAPPVLQIAFRPKTDITVPPSPPAQALPGVVCNQVRPNIPKAVLVSPSFTRASVVAEVELAPPGEVRSVRIAQSSGYPELDDAVSNEMKTLQCTFDTPLQRTVRVRQAFEFRAN